MTVDAAPQAVWEAVLHVVERSFSSSRSAAAARVLGCRDVGASGPRPLAEGSSFPGFHAAVAEAPRELALAGRHRFSGYALIFRMGQAGGHVRLCAETRAEFPRLHGKFYRAAVIGTGLHVRVVRGLLTAAKRRAERGAERA